MQLFITKFTKTGNQINIDNKEVLDQMRKVLRMKIGDRFFVQNDSERLETEILDRDKTTIKGKILNTEENKSSNKYSQLSIAVAMSNKRTKVELIVQKLSEIGINNIYFRPSERSVIKDANDKKIERLYKISKEAVEQSRGRELPKIEFIKDISKIIQDNKVIIFDKTDCDSSPTGKLFRKTSWGLGNILGIIGPEGGLTEKDYQKFGDSYEIVSLGDTVLRTETASIIAGRTLKNLD